LDYIEPHHSLDILRTGRNTTAKKIMSADNKKAITLRTPSMQLLGGAVVPKSKTGYCGLYNPGCICYMNSTLQQLFMTSAFRKGILEIETDIRNKDDTEIAEDMLYQLQLLFAYLQESDKAYVDPRGFSYSFRDYEGMPTDNMVQQDASEFLANFFQQIEGAIMGTKSETLLKDTFGGVLSNELLAEENRRSERPEPFYMLSVAVGQSNKCLSDALESYIAGDTVDYTWESGGKDNIPLTKVSLPTIKRVSIKTLPNKLIVHLKRFEFDFETMQQIKINDRFEYPMNLNMYPYTVDARQRNENSGNESSSDEPIVNPENYMYELTGVVVHLGTAHSGHYYSYIRSDAGILSLSEETDDQAKQKWFEFNDSFVSEFDPEDLEDETFGGSDTHVLSTSSSAASLSNKVGSPGGVTPQKPVTHAKVQNAFMLVYTRSIQSPMSTVSESRSRARTMSTEVAPQVSASILESIRKDNMMYWRTKCIFNPVYYKFLSDVLMQKKYLRIENSPASSHLVESLLDKSVRIALGTMVQAREIDFVATWANWLKSVLQGYPRRCYIVLNILCGEQTTSKVTEAYTDIMQEQQQTSTPLQCLNRLLLGPEDPDIRHTIMRVIRCCMETLLQQSDHVENQSSTDASEDVSATDSYDACMKFVQMVVALIRDAQISWRHIDVFFDPITVFASFQKKAQQELVSMGVLGSLISFFLGHDTPFPALVGGAEPGNHKSRSMTDGVYFPNMKSLLLAVAALLPDVSKDSKGLSRMTAGVDMSSECITMMQSAVFQYR
jgi:ubiquitin C-terminal hydrolase